jgi:hypothetical protein
MPSDEFGGLFTYTPSQEEIENNDREFFASNFIRETIFSSGDRTSYHDKPVPIIDIEDVHEIPATLSPAKPTPPALRNL